MVLLITTAPLVVPLRHTVHLVASAHPHDLLRLIEGLASPIDRRHPTDQIEMIKLGVILELTSARPHRLGVVQTSDIILIVADTEILAEPQDHHKRDL